MSALDHVWGDKQGARAAFPSEISKGRDMEGRDIIERQPGVSVRQYYAAKAPAIPDWFQPVRKTVRPVAPMVPFARGSVESTEYFSVINGLLVKDRACKAVQDFCRTLQNVKRAQGEWDAQGESERFFAWRWHYADMMIETEGK